MMCVLYIVGFFLFQDRCIMCVYRVCAKKSPLKRCTRYPPRFADVITIVPEITDIPKNSADVLVSEWMGYLLLTEDVLGDFVAAREHALKRDGREPPGSCMRW